MNASGLDSRLLLDSQLLRAIAIASINGYQKYLSPHKGFSCAHRVLHGGESCSQYVKSAVAKGGLSAAIALSQQRFAACKQAHQILRSQMGATAQRKKKPKPAPSYPVSDCGNTELAPGFGCDGCMDTLECVNLFNCGEISCSDCSPLEDSTLDCSGGDCDFSSCG